MDPTIVAAVIGAVATIVTPIVAILVTRYPPPWDWKKWLGWPWTPPKPGKKKPLGSPPPRITVYGEVVGTSKALGIRVENEAEMREFWRTYSIATKLDWAGKGPPIASINRQGDIARCKPGDRANLTLEVEDRSGKRCTKTVAFEVQSHGA